MLLHKINSLPETNSLCVWSASAVELNEWCVDGLGSSLSADAWH